MNTFHKDLDWGTHFEKASITHIQNHFTQIFKIKNYDCRFIKENDSIYISTLKNWDLMFGIYQGDKLIKQLTVEVKTDKYKSNNIFIEKRCNKIDSGVFSTTADFFLYILPRHNTQNFFIVQPYQLRNILLTNYSHTGKYGGDRQASFGFLVDKDEFLDDYVLAGGIVHTIDFDIPSHFGLTKF